MILFSNANFNSTKYFAWMKHFLKVLLQLLDNLKSKGKKSAFALEMIAVSEHYQGLSRSCADVYNNLVTGKVYLLYFI